VSSAIVAGIAYIFNLIFRGRFRPNRKEAIAVLLMLASLAAGLATLFVYDPTRRRELHQAEIQKLEGDLSIGSLGSLKAQIHNGTEHAIPEITVLLRVVNVVSEPDLVAQFEAQQKSKRAVPPPPPGFRLEPSPSTTNSVSLDELEASDLAQRSTCELSKQVADPPNQSVKVITSRIYRLWTTNGRPYEDSEYYASSSFHLQRDQKIVCSILGAKWGP
jgi:hypothetical protein